MSAFLDALDSRPSMIGLWQALATPYTAEICARAGYDWLLFDGEHAPNTIRSMLTQLQAVTPFGCLPVARIAAADPVLIKQHLDIGFETLLVPMVNSAAEAKLLVEATRFPPLGTRGVASSTSRASGFGADRDYLRTAHLRTSLIVQIESREALDEIEAIALIDGVDALFIGPGDLAASLGYLGEPSHPEVQEHIANAKRRIDAAGKPVGIFAVSAADARARIAEGYRFVSVGTDIGLLATGALTLRESI
jgi:4-hydroxy-2-oxoheptanedioate aldolase